MRRLTQQERDGLYLTFIIFGIALDCLAFFLMWAAQHPERIH